MILTLYFRITLVNVNKINFDNTAMLKYYIFNIILFYLFQTCSCK